jgi:hypothetical protein
MRDATAWAFVAVAVAASSAHADPATTRAAAEHFRKAEAADQAKRYAEAIAEYEAAYRLAPHPDVLYNIALDHERLEEWAAAADAYQRYLDDHEAPAADAATVAAKIRELRVKARNAAPSPPRGNDGGIEGGVIGGAPAPDRTMPPVASNPDANPPLAGPPAITPAVVATAERAYSRYHLAASYGVAFGSEPSERYQLRVGMRFGGRVDLDALGGTFGLNDYAIGAMARVAILRDVSVQPVLIAAATVGIARQDASSKAGTKIPFGAEAGAGIQLNRHYRLELDAFVRVLANGWSASETDAFTYVNDAVAFAIDLGAALDFPVISGAR